MSTLDKIKEIESIISSVESPISTFFFNGLQKMASKNELPVPIKFKEKKKKAKIPAPPLEVVEKEPLISSIHDYYRQLDPGSKYVLLVKILRDPSYGMMKATVTGVLGGLENEEYYEKPIDRPVIEKQSSASDVIQCIKKAIDNYGITWIDWEYEVIDRALGECANYIKPIKAMLVSDAFFTSPFAFEKITLALNGREPSMMLENLLPMEMVLSTAIAFVLRSDGEYHPDVEHYIASQLVDDGHLVLFFPFNISQSLWGKYGDYTKQIYDHIYSKAKLGGKALDAFKYYDSFLDKVKDLVSEIKYSLEEK